MYAAYLFDNAGGTLGQPRLDQYIPRDTCIRHCRSRDQSLSNHLQMRTVRPVCWTTGEVVVVRLET